MDYQVIGNRIRGRRRDLEMTQEAVAEKSGISISFLGHIERGSRIASIETLYFLCSTLGLSVDEVIGLPKVNAPTPEECARSLLEHALHLAGQLTGRSPGTPD